MKAFKIPYLLILPLCILFCLTGCGKREDIIYVQSTYEALLYEDRADMYVILGEQYYQGEAVRISCNREGDIFLHRDGEEAELFLTNVSDDYAHPIASWWLDEDGSIFVLYENMVILLNAEGKETARVTADGMVSDICRSKDGRLVIKINNAEKFTNGLAFLDMEAGKIGEIIWLNSIIYSISAGAKQDILLVDEGGICNYSLTEKKKEYYMNFSNADYTPAGRIWDIHYLSEGQIDLLTDGEMIVTLRKVNLSESGKIFLTYKTAYVRPEVKELIVRFNQQNDDYYIRVEECPQGYDPNDFREKISMEIAAGHGPDIIDDNNSVASLYELLEMNAFEDLRPYMEKAGIDESAYFDGLLVPMEGMEGIYALRYGIGVSTMCIDGEVLGTTMEEWDFSTKWDIDTELNMLEAYDGDKAFSINYDSAGMLIHWLKFSEDLCGMVDWEQRTCHFEGEKWERMVNLAKKYGYREEKKENGWIAYVAPFWDFTLYSARENGMWESNKIPVGYASDTGGITWLYYYEMYMNASSTHKEGIWQFFHFLLQEEAQYSLVMNQSGSYFPIHRQAFAEAGKYFIENPIETSFHLVDGWDGSTTGLTEEQLVRLEEYIDRAEIITWTWRTDPILDIIREEMDVYYAGGKPLEEVSAIIDNRVQLYLNELD